MPAADWFRHPTWTPADQTAFRARLARARPASRAQYLRLQALALTEAPAPQLEGALALLDELLREYPEDLFRSATLELRGQVLNALGQPAAALEAFRGALATQRARRNVRGHAHVAFAETALTTRDPAARREALLVLEEWGGEDPFPSGQFRESAARAKLLAAEGDRREAAVWAERALAAASRTEAPFPRHPSVGLVAAVPTALEAELRELAASA